MWPCTKSANTIQQAVAVNATSDERDIIFIIQKSRFINEFTLTEEWNANLNIVVGEVLVHSVNEKLGHVCFAWNLSANNKFLSLSDVDTSKFVKWTLFTVSETPPPSLHALSLSSLDNKICENRACEKLGSGSCGEVFSHIPNDFVQLLGTKNNNPETK